MNRKWFKQLKGKGGNHIWEAGTIIFFCMKNDDYHNSNLFD